MKHHLYKNDLPDNVTLHGDIAVDTEAMGLEYNRDRLCVIQLSDGNGEAHVVQFDKDNYDAPNLRALLADESRTKIMHFARFDMAIIQHYMNIVLQPVYCTKIASKLARTYTDAHGLKVLLAELMSIGISKQQQSSDWGADKLTKDQVKYAAEDVLFLHDVRKKLDVMLEREGRKELAVHCFEFLRHRVALDLSGWNEKDIFAH